MQCLLIDATSGWCHFPRSGTSLPHSTHLMVDIVIYVSHLVHVQLKKYSRRKWMEYSKEYPAFMWWSLTYSLQVQQRKNTTKGYGQHSTEQERAEWSSTLRSYSVARPKWFFLRIVDQGWMKAISMWSDTSEKYDATIQKNFHLEEIRQEGCRMELVSWAWESIRWNQQHNHRRFRSFTAVLRSS